MTEKYFIPSCELEYQRLNILHYTFFEATKRVLEQAGLNQNKPNLRALDIGCAIGLMTEWIADNTSNQVTGFDIDTNQIEQASLRLKDKNISNINFEQLNIGEKLDSNNKLLNQADIVYCRLVLHHLNNPKTGINNLINLAKPGGEILFIEPITDGMWDYPELPETAQMFKYLIKLNKDNPWDPDYGKKLLSDLSSFNTIEIKSAEVFRPVLRDKENKLHFNLVCKIFREKLISLNIADKNTLDKIEKATSDAAQNSNYTSTLFAINIVRAVKL
jgi:ubiquinone/menaquinone biosynthesis C-methylase UbiE